MSRTLRSLLLVPAAILVVGCASIEPLTVPASHPASEEAPVAPFEAPPPIASLPDARRAAPARAPAAPMMMHHDEEGTAPSNDAGGAKPHDGMDMKRKGDGVPAGHEQPLTPEVAP